MTYTPTNWVAGVTPVNPTNMNNIEQGIAALDAALTNALNAVGATPAGSIQVAADSDLAPFFVAPYQPSFNYVSVRDFGATGDGVTDDQSALQSAFTAGKTAGLPVYVPPGTYLHSGRLTVECKVFGAPGGRASILKGTTYEVHSLDMEGGNPELHNLTIMAGGKSPRSSDRGGNGVYVDTATNYRIVNCHILQVPGAGIMGEFSSNGKVRYCQIELTGADGIYHTEASHDVEISYNKCIACGDDAIAATTYTAVTYNIEAHHNTLLGAWESRAMSMNGGNNFNFHDNHIDGGTAGLSVTDHYGSVQTTSSSYTNNTVRNINKYSSTESVVGGGSIHLWNDLAGIMTGISITGNRVYNSLQNDIYVGGTSQITATIGSNTFYSGVTFLDNANTHGSTVITQSPANTDSTTGSYPGDLIASTVGGMVSTYEYDPAVVL